MLPMPQHPKQDMHTHLSMCQPYAHVHTLTHAWGLGTPQMLQFVAARSVIPSPWISLSQNSA